MDKLIYPNKAKPIYCPELGTYYPSASNCAKTLGISLQNIRKVLKGDRQTCHGYHFEYAPEEVQDKGEE
jgi:hypothetical protein